MNVLGAAAVALVLAAGGQGVEQSDEDLFAAGVQALADERPNDAIGAFEILADRGRMDPVVSYDRGLAYAARVRAGAEAPGDLGKAAHGFEEAIALTDDDGLRLDATRALEQVRTEVGRRRAREGTAVELDTRKPLWRSLSQSLPENAWSVSAIVAGLVLAGALFVRWRSSARLSDARGIALAGSSPLPEGARVELLTGSGGLGALTEVRAGGTQAFLPSSALRPIAKR